MALDSTSFEKGKVAGRYFVVAQEWRVYAISDISQVLPLTSRLTVGRRITGASGEVFDSIFERLVM